MAASTVSSLKLDSKHQKEIIENLNDVESLIYEWLHSSKYKNKWKHIKSVTNDHLNIKCNDDGVTNEIVIDSLSLKSSKNKKFTVWKATGYLPCDAKTAIEYYTNPKHFLEYDDDETMSKLDQFMIEMDDDTQVDINVAVTNPRLNGLISKRLSTNINCTKYSNKMDNWCCLGRFVTESMLKQIKDKLRITNKEMKYTMSKNLNQYWSADKSIIINHDIKLTKITYILQVNNGGWIPQWAVEKGLIDQHMIAIFKQITKWINKNSVSISIKEEHKQESKETHDEIVYDDEISDIMSTDKESDWIQVSDNNDDEDEILSDVVYIEKSECLAPNNQCLMM